MSAIVIGAATQVSFAGGGYCITSVNWGYQPNTQRFYCIGSWDPYIQVHKPTETLSLTLYAPGPNFSLTPTQDCVDATPEVSATVDPAACSSEGETFPVLAGNWQISGYSYNKDDGSMPGQETWNLTKWKNLSTPDPSVGDTVEPNFVMRGISEGQGTLDSGLGFGVDAVQSYTGSVSAGGFGRADIVYVGTITSVGGGSSTAGATGQGSATIPLTPFYY